jgi:hypothetical protein
MSKFIQKKVFLGKMTPDVVSARFSQQAVVEKNLDKFLKLFFKNLKILIPT